MQTNWNNKAANSCCSLNPHCSENGMFGTEEMDEIIPAVEFAREKGINCIGPVAPVPYFQKQQAVFMILLLQCIMIRVISAKTYGFKIRSGKRQFGRWYKYNFRPADYSCFG